MMTAPQDEDTLIADLALGFKFVHSLHALWKAWPELLAFEMRLADEEDGPAHWQTDPDDTETERFDLHVTCDGFMRDDYEHDMCTAVTEFLSRALRAEPDLLRVLRDRLFVRTWH